MRATFSLMISLVLAPPLAAQAAPQDSVAARQLALGRQYSEWFLGGEMDSIVAHMSGDVKEKSGGAARLQEQRAQLAARAGEEAKVLEEKMTRRRGMPQYWRAAPYTEMALDPIVLRWLFDSEGRIVGMGLGPLSQTPAPDAP